MPIIGLWRKRRFQATLQLSRNEAKAKKDRPLFPQTERLQNFFNRSNFLEIPSSPR